MAAPPPTKPSSKNPTPTLSFLHNLPKAPLKRSKLRSKHALLLSRITTSASKKGSSSKITKRRRPGKKLVTSLDSLAKALPSATDDDGAWEGIIGAEGDGTDRVNKIQHKSLKSRPGAGKKKEALVAMERERFARNLAEMCAEPSIASQNATNGGARSVERVEGERGSADRWAAIRGFICQTMERRPEGEAVVGKKK